MRNVGRPFRAGVAAGLKARRYKYMYRPRSSAAEQLVASGGPEGLQRHLAARFGQGPLPAPWPLAALTKAGKVDFLDK